MRFLEGLPIREIRRRTGLHRETIRRALRSPAPPSYSRPARSSKLDGFREEIHELLRVDAGIEREILQEHGYEGGKTITDDYVREVRPFFLDQRTYHRTVYRPGDLVQFDLWQPRHEIPVGYGQTRKGYVVVGVLGYARFGAGALVFSKEAPDVLWGMWRCCERIGALPERFVTDREGCLHAGGGRPTGEFAAFCGQLAVGWRILDPGDCGAKGVVERSRACPHGPNASRHDGHANSPPTSSASTSATSAHTINMVPPPASKRALPTQRPSWREDSRAFKNARSLPTPRASCRR